MFAVSSAISLVVFALPAGYVTNFRLYGNPIGTEMVLEQHSAHGKSITEAAKNGTRNLFRYGLDFVALDGLPPARIIKLAQASIKRLPVAVARRCLDLDAVEGTREPWDAQKAPAASEDHSYWGILGFGLIWPVVILSAIGAIRQSGGIRILAFSALLFIFVQAYAGPYDPWRGRYFACAAVIAVPTIGTCIDKKGLLLRTYVLLVISVACVSALSAVALREDGGFISIGHRTAIIRLDRISQLTFNRSEYAAPIREFDRLVPASATVAICLPEDSYEYPLFGNHLTRTIIPIDPYDSILQPIPENAGWLLYSDRYPYPLGDDLSLGAGWHLRRLPGHGGHGAS
jgi:hypothetical protein